MNLTPKKHFQEKKVMAEHHRELVVSDAFREALHASLIDQVMAMPMTYDPVEAQAAYNRIMGARDFIQHLLTIAEMPKDPPKPTSTNLNHEVK